MKNLDEILKSKRIWDWCPMPKQMQSAWIRLPDCGTCSLLWCDNENGYEHVSIAPVKQHNIPSWDDMCILKDIFFDEEEEAYQIHPKKSEYVNISLNCLHLWKPIGHELCELIAAQ